MRMANLMQLMSCIAHDSRFESAVKKWSAEKELMTTAFYFWRNGTADQRSRNGFIRSTLFQILSTRPNLTASAVQISDGAIPAWTGSRLQTAPHNVLERAAADSRIFMFIDGLDESDEDAHSREELLALVNRLSRLPDVKILVSSRPELIFTQAFRVCDSSGYKT